MAIPHHAPLPIGVVCRQLIWNVELELRIYRSVDVGKKPVMFELVPIVISFVIPRWAVNTDVVEW
jgi:hypothetical protein